MDVDLIVFAAVAIVIVLLLPRLIKRSRQSSAQAVAGQRSVLPSRYGIMAAPFLFFALGVLTVAFSPLFILGLGFFGYAIATALSAFGARHYAAQPLDMRDTSALYKNSRNIPAWYKRTALACFILSTIVGVAGLIQYVLTTL